MAAINYLEHGVRISFDEAKVSTGQWNLWIKRSSVVTTMPYIESNFNGTTKHFAGCQSRPTKGRQF